VSRYANEEGTDEFGVPYIVAISMLSQDKERSHWLLPVSELHCGNWRT
jgi:hypothetical protein